MRAVVLGSLVLISAAMAGPAVAEVEWDYVRPTSERSIGQWLSEILGVSELGRSYAVIIGLHQYDDFNPLDATEADPGRVFNFLRDEAGFDYILMLRDDEVNYPRLRTLFEFELPSILTTKDRFLLFWSGHGTQFKNARGSDEGYLPLTSSSRKDKSTMVSMSELTRWDDQLPAKHVLYLLDACFSGLAGVAAQSDDEPLEIAELAEPGHHIISAGGRNQQTIASRQEWQGSIFTHALLKALGGQADRYGGKSGGDGVINLNELVEDIRETVTHEKALAGWKDPLRPILHVFPGRGEGQFFFLTREKKRAHLEAQGKRVGDEMAYGMPQVLGDSAPIATVACDRETDRLFWDGIKHETSPAYFEAYLKQVESGDLCGQFADIARLKLATQVAALPARPAPVPEPLAAPARADPNAPERAFDRPPEDRTTYRSAFRDCELCPEMVVVPAGSFTMGSSFGPDVEKPAREVHVQAGFALSRYEVTVAEWEACVVVGGCDRHSPSTTGRGGDREPIVNVSWDDAQAYAAWLSETTGAPYRLPSEAEWEYAARAGSDGKFTGGAVILDKDANFAGANGGPIAVGSYPPNAFGLHDVHGNVWEWVEDCFHPYPSFPTTAAPARVLDCQLRGLRGGAWDSDASALRLANRAFRDSAVRHPTIGFRVARSLAPEDLQARR